MTSALRRKGRTLLPTERMLRTSGILPDRPQPVYLAETRPDRLTDSADTPGLDSLGLDTPDSGIPGLDTPDSDSHIHCSFQALRSCPFPVSSRTAPSFCNVFRPYSDQDSVFCCLNLKRIHSYTDILLSGSWLRLIYRNCPVPDKAS